MKFLKAAKISAFLTFFATSVVMAGGMEGGGGMGVLCTTHLRTLDLYEAEEVHHFPISNKYSDVDTNLAIYGTQIAAYRSDSPTNTNDSWIQQEILKYLKREIVTRFQDIPAGTKLPLSNDATLPSIPSGCSFVQIVTYADDGKIYRDRELWDLLDVQNQSALILHEGIYHRAKMDGAKTSDNTRYVVGLTFAEKLPEPILQPIWDSPKKVWCGTQKTIGENFELFAVNETRAGQSGVGIYFVTFNNELQMERLSAFVPNMDVYDFFYQSYPLMKTSALGSLFGNSWNLEFKSDYQDDYGIKIRAENASPSGPFSWAHCEIRL